MSEKKTPADLIKDARDGLDGARRVRSPWDLLGDLADALEASEAAREKDAAANYRAGEGLADRMMELEDAALRMTKERDAALARAEKAEAEFAEEHAARVDAGLRERAAIAQVAVLRGALEFYAVREHYLANVDGVFEYRVRDDNGERARAALRETAGGEKKP